MLPRSWNWFYWVAPELRYDELEGITVTSHMGVCRLFIMHTKVISQCSKLHWFEPNSFLLSLLRLLPFYFSLSELDRGTRQSRCWWRLRQSQISCNLIRRPRVLTGIYRRLITAATAAGGVFCFPSSSCFLKSPLNSHLVAPRRLCITRLGIVGDKGHKNDCFLTSQAPYAIDMLHKVIFQNMELGGKRAVHEIRERLCSVKIRLKKDVPCLHQHFFMVIILFLHPSE